MSADSNRFERFMENASDFVQDEGNQNLAIGAMGFGGLFLFGLNYIVPALGGGFWTKLLSIPIVFSAAAMATPAVVRWTRQGIDKIQEFVDNPTRTAGLETDAPAVEVSQVQEQGTIQAQHVAEQIQEVAGRMEAAEVSASDDSQPALPPQVVAQIRASQNLVS